MSAFRTVGSILLIALVAGCGGRERGVTVKPPSPQALAKAILEDTAAQGKVTSVETLREKLEALKETDAAKANELLADYKQLTLLSDPRAISAKAKQMAGKLGPVQQ